MDELPADAPAVALAPAVAGDAVADALETPELFDVDVDQLAGVLPLIALHRLGGLKVAHSAQSDAPEDTADGRRRDACELGDMLSGEALATQRNDFIAHRLRRWLAEPMRARRNVHQPLSPRPPKSFDPFPGSFRANVESVRDFADRVAAFDDAARQLRSTVRRQTGILMDVHPGLREKVKLRNSTFLGPVRMDNLLQAHI
jgi:hypothetical protein